MSDQPCADSPPASQNTADCTRSAKATISDVVAAPNSEAIAIPARISRPIPPPRGPDQAIMKTSPAAATPNTSAPTGSSAIEPGKTSRMRIAPNAAPPVTPITSGEASGLASAPCSSAPATPSAAPTTSALIVRGSRSWSTISRNGPGSACPVSASITSLSGTWTAPSVSDAAAAATRAAADTSITVTWRTATAQLRRYSRRTSRIVRPTSVHGCSSELPVDT